MITNWTTNNTMRVLLEKINCSSLDSLTINFSQLNTLFFPPFKQVKDCIIISDKTVDCLDTNFDKAIEMYVDKTGYEASNTETRINSFFENYISMEVGTKFALIVLEIWALQLKKLEPQSNFCFIMCSDENCVEIRFHKIHSNEEMWLDENLENYTDGAIGYAIV